MVKIYYKEESFMTLIPLETLNKQAREQFNDWYHDKAMEPNLKLVSDRIGLGYGTLKQFKIGTDVTYKNISKIIEFLETQGYKLKEHA